MIGNIIVFQ